MSGSSTSSSRQAELGDIVHYVESGGRCEPALVVAVHGPSCVSVRTFRNDSATPGLATSVMLDESPHPRPGTFHFR